MRIRSGQSSWLMKMVSGTSVRYYLVYLLIVIVCTSNWVSAGNTGNVNNLKSPDGTPSLLKLKTPSVVGPTYLHLVTNASSPVTEYRSIGGKVVLAASDKEPLKSDKESFTSTTGNELWDGIIKQCLAKPTFSCFQKNVYTYLDRSLETGDVNVTSRFKFKKNRLDYAKCEKEFKDPDGPDDIAAEEEARSASPIEEVTDALYGKGMKFMMTHDIELKMPDMMFDGATFRISPRSFEGNGAIVKLEFIPKELEARSNNDKATGRILFKKIKKFFRGKLMLALLALLLVIKIIKIKLFWLLPLFIGVGAAKKLVLKFLLFLFPALAQIFKLCSYYHKNYHETRYHHHLHHIDHHHTIVPTHHNEPYHGHDHGHGHGPPPGAELIFTNPPKGHPSEYIHGAPPPYVPHGQQPWDFTSPGLGSEFISDRNSQVFKPKLDDANEIKSWGLGMDHVTPGSSKKVNPFRKESHPSFIGQNQQMSGINPVYVAPDATKPRVPVASQIAAQYGPTDINVMKDLQAQAQAQEAIRIQNEQRLIAQQQKLLQQQAFIRDPTNPGVKYEDEFYSPILARIDKIFIQLRFMDEPCRERLVCSMYKNPHSYSPHSNFISAELSRDLSELKQPLDTNAAVIRFYRYFQSARDGQDQKDCLSLYPGCSINTEQVGKKKRK